LGFLALIITVMLSSSYHEIAVNRINKKFKFENLKTI